jgi:hypothetical protein
MQDMLLVCVLPLQLVNQLTDLNEISYEHMPFKPPHHLTSVLTVHSINRRMYEPLRWDRLYYNVTKGHGMFDSNW